MIGNDIVDLDQARRDSHWRRNGFLAKVFTDHEQQLIREAVDSDTLVWLLWSMKESAYKAIVRETGERFFAPRNLACHLTQMQDGRADGSVFYRKHYSTRSVVTTHYVASVAFLAGVDQSFTNEIVTFDSADYLHQHTTIRKKVKQHYVKRFCIGADTIQIQKDSAGSPMLTLAVSDESPICQPISLSHHGHYGAFAVLHESINYYFTPIN